MKNWIKYISENKNAINAYANWLSGLHLTAIIIANITIKIIKIEIKRPPIPLVLER